MKILLWREAVNPIVIPNGIPKEAMRAPNPADVMTLREGSAGDMFLFKIGRFDPDKRWLMAMTAAARLKRQGVRVRMLIRGDRGPHGADVLAHASRQGLTVADIGCAGRSTARSFLWDSVIGQLFARLELAEARQGVRQAADT